ncbi:MAG: DUF748 domain-containing protein [Rubrivivax sp.]
MVGSARSRNGVRRRIRTAAGIVAALALVAGAVGAAAALWLPGWLHQRLEVEASQRLGRAVSLERLDLSWARPGVTLRGLRVSAAPAVAAAAGLSATSAAAPQFELARLRVELSWASLLRLAPVVQALELQAPKLRVARLADGRTDVDDILARLRAAEPEGPGSEAAASPVPRFALSGVRLSEGEVEFDDRVVRQALRLTALRIELPGLSTLEGAEAARAEPRVGFLLQGVPVEVSAAAQPFAATPVATVSLALREALPLAPAWAYLPAELGRWPGRPEGGQLAAELQLRLAQPAGQPLQWQLTGQAALQDIAWRMALGREPLGWQRLAVEGLEVLGAERRVTLAALRLQGARLELGRDRRGRFMIDSHPVDPASSPPAPAQAVAGSQPSPPPSSAQPPWQVQVREVAVSAARIGWTDATTAPAARLRVEALSASAGPLAWPAGDPVPFELDAQLRGAAGGVARLQVKGQGSPEASQASARLEGLALEAFAPYLAATLRPALSGRVSLAASVQARLQPALALTVRVPTLDAEALRLTEAGAREPVAQVQALRLREASVELPAQRVRVGTLKVEAPQLQLARGASGSVNAEGWLASAPGGAARNPQPSSPGWSGQLGEFVVERARMRWRDEGAAVRREDGGPLELSVAVPRIAAQALAWPPRREPVRARAEVQVEPATPQDPPGRIVAEASVEVPAGRARGTLQVERLPLHRVAPYAQAGLPVRVAGAELGVRSRFDLTLTPDGPAGQVEGQALLADVLLRSRVAGTDVRVGDELLSWQSLALGPARVTLRGRERPAVEVESIVLSDAYSRLVITEGGTFNLVDTVQDDRRQKADATAPAAESVVSASAAPTAAPATAASTAAAAPTAAAATPWPLALTVGETRLVRGRMDFSDRFVKPNFSAALTELEGRLGRFSTEARDLPALELNGRAAGTAELQVRGSLNPTVNPPVLDLAAQASGFELSTISTYAAKYAGYGIERGKLSLNLAYRVDPDGRLQARNQVVINQLTFGEKVDSPDATKLPVRLAVALLTDRHGVIDLDLPVSGSINDPQFSVFGLVLKVLGNLIVKAVTAPFAWLTGGGGEQASVVEFEPGTAVLASASGAAIDRVAQALGDRPALRMTVTGAADPVSEREAMQADALAQRLLAEQRRELARAGRALAADAPLAPLAPEERLRLLRRIYDETNLPDKPANPPGQPQAVPAEQMEAMLKRAVIVSIDTARELAIRRGLAVREALVARGLSAERLFLGAPRLRVTGEDDAAWTPRVQLAISAP